MRLPDSNINAFEQMRCAYLVTREMVFGGSGNHFPFCQSRNFTSLMATVMALMDERRRALCATTCLRVFPRLAVKSGLTGALINTFESGFMPGCPSCKALSVTRQSGSDARSFNFHFI